MKPGKVNDADYCSVCGLCGVDGGIHRPSARANGGALSVHTEALSNVARRPGLRPMIDAPVLNVAAPPRVVAVAGPKGSGKSTVAGRLAERWGFREASFAAPLKALVEDVAAPIGAVPAVLWGASTGRDRELLIARSASAWAEVMRAVELNANRAARLFERAPPSAPGFDPARVRAAWFECWDAMRVEALTGVTRLSARTMLQRVGTDWGRGLWRDVWPYALLTDVRAGKHGPRVAISDARFADNEGAPVRAAGGSVWWIDRPGFEPASDAHNSEPRYAQWASVANVVIENNEGIAKLLATVDSLMLMTLN